MSRCGCGNGTCPCKIEAGTNIFITGDGASTNPYKINVTGGGLGLTAPTSPVDGQLVAWSATLQKWVAVNPSGKSELAYAENASGAYQTVTAATPANVTGCVIVVPISARPVYLSAGIYFGMVTTGVGNATLQLLETTTGLAAVAAGSFVLRGETLTANTQNRSVQIPPFRIGPTTVARTFKLTAAIFVDSGSPAANVFNGYSGSYYKSWIAAEAR